MQYVHTWLFYKVYIYERILSEQSVTLSAVGGWDKLQTHVLQRLFLPFWGSGSHATNHRPGVVRRLRPGCAALLHGRLPAVAWSIRDMTLDLCWIRLLRTVCFGINLRLNVSKCFLGNQSNLCKPLPSAVDARTRPGIIGWLRLRRSFGGCSCVCVGVCFRLFFSLSLSPSLSLSLLLSLLVSLFPALYC